MILILQSTISILSLILYSKFIHYVTSIECSHRINNPYVTLITHLVSFTLSSIVCYYYRGQILLYLVIKVYKLVFGDLPVTNNPCFGHSLPKLTLIGYIIILIRGILGVFSKSIWFETESHDHHHGAHNLAEKYVQESFTGLVIVLIFISDPFNNMLKSLVLSIILGSIIYSYKEIWNYKLMKRTRNFRKIFLSNMVQCILLLTIITYQDSPLPLVLSTVLNLTLSIDEFIELVGCSYRVYNLYSIKNYPSISFTQFIKVTFTIVISHLAEHLGPILFHHNMIHAGIIFLLKNFFTFYSSISLVLNSEHSSKD